MVTVDGCAAVADVTVTAVSRYDSLVDVLTVFIHGADAAAAHVWLQVVTRWRHLLSDY